jgi:hypothetical protein
MSCHLQLHNITQQIAPTCIAANAITTPPLSAKRDEAIVTLVIHQTVGVLVALLPATFILDQGCSALCCV